MRLQTTQHRLRIPLEESHQVQVPNNQHHREQEYDRLEVNVAERVCGLHDAEGDHRHRPDDGRARAIDFQPGKLSQRENHVAGEEDGVGGGDANVRQRGGREGGHWVRSG